MSGQAAIILDLDDTLYLEADYVASGFRSLNDHVFARFGRGNFFDEAWGRFSQGERGTIFDEVLRSRGVSFTPDDITEMVRLYHHHEPDIQLAADATRFLAKAPATCKLGIITDGPVSCQSAKTRALKLADMVDLVIMTDEWGVAYRKPHPRAFMAMMQRFEGLRPSQFVYVADNPKKDFSAPKQLGWWTVRIKRQNGLHAAVVGGEPGLIDRTIHSLDEIEIEKLRQGNCP